MWHRQRLRRALRRRSHRSHRLRLSRRLDHLRRQVPECPADRLRPLRRLHPSRPADRLRPLHLSRQWVPAHPADLADRSRRSVPEYPAGLVVQWDLACSWDRWDRNCSSRLHHKKNSIRYIRSSGSRCGKRRNRRAISSPAFMKIEVGELLFCSPAYSMMKGADVCGVRPKEADNGDIALYDRQERGGTSGAVP